MFIQKFLYNIIIQRKNIHYIIKKIIECLLLVGIVILLFYLLSINNNKLPSYKENRPVGKQTHYTITGIEAGDGEMKTTQRAIKAYGLNKSGWQLQSSSMAIMLSQLGKAIKNHQSIIITGWVPHWMFVKYKIKFLKDPKNIYGNNEHYDSIARPGLKKDNPGAYQFLKNFYMKMNKAQKVVSDINNGESPNQAANKYVKQNPKQIKQWLKNVPEGHGKRISIAHASYTYETFVTEAAAKVLRTRGYKADVKQLDTGIMFSAIVSKSVDASLTAELPVTEGIYAKKYKGEFDKVKINLKGARIGLAVPKYMKNVNSISDLKK